MKNIYLIYFLLLITPVAYTQQKIADAGLVRLIKQQDSLQQHLPVEKLYLQTDKAVYTVGDTIWFKVYLLDQHLAGSKKSGMINLDIATDSANVIKRYRLLVRSGIGKGNISLDKN